MSRAVPLNILNRTPRTLPILFRTQKSCRLEEDGGKMREQMTTPQEGPNTSAPHCVSD